MAHKPSIEAGLNSGMAICIEVGQCDQGTCHTSPSPINLHSKFGRNWVNITVFIEVGLMFLG